MERVRRVQRASTMEMQSGTSRSPALMLPERTTSSSQSPAQAEERTVQNPVQQVLRTRAVQKLLVLQLPQGSDQPTPSTHGCGEALPARAIPSNQKIP
jgi:hypothetical protein